MTRSITPSVYGSRDVQLTRQEREFLRRVLRDEARRLGYGAPYHDETGYPNGPNDWPRGLRVAAGLMRKVGRS